MKKLFLFTITALFALQIQAKEIRLIKKGGEPCKGDKSKVCYDKVQIRSTDEVYQQACENPGHESCPKIGIATVGGSLAFDVDNFVFNVEQSILSGETEMNGVILNANNEVVAHYDWTGLINDSGFIEYEIVINDEA